jgi:hypothetical protein
MRPDLCVTALLTLTALPAAADCANTFSAIATLLNLPPVAAPAPDADGWCHLTDLRLGGESQFAPVIDIATLSWRQTGPVTLTGDRLTLPQDIDLRLDGLRIGVVTGDAVMDWLMAAQRQPNPISATLSLTTQGDTVTLNGLAIDFPGDNAVTLAASVRGLKTADTDTLFQSLPQAQLTALDLAVTSNGLFETYALMPLGTALLSGATDPAAQVAAAQTIVRARIAGLPDSLFDATERDALGALVADLPNPTGTFTLTLDAPTGLGTNRLAPIAIRGVAAFLADPAPYFDGIDIAVTYTPAPGETP